jgi:hypothetical protein
MTTLSSSRPDRHEPTDPLDIQFVREGLDLERGEDEECLATFWRQATPGTTYVRCLLPARYLPAQALGLRSMDLDWDEERDQMVMPRFKGTTAVWQFLGDDWRSRIAWGLQDQGIRTLMEVDDNYLIHHPHQPGQKLAWHRTIRESSAPGETGYSNEMHRLLVPTMDGIIVSTEYLRDRYLEYTDNVYVCPNTVDPVDWEDQEEKDPSVLRIVYSGSQSHLRDAPQLNKALKWASRQKGVEVWLQGVNPIWGFATNVPWTESLREYRRVMGRFDVGLAPLIGGTWADGKSDLKALEYSMAGVVPFVAHEEPYRPWFDFQEQVVESSTEEWLDRVKWIVRNRDALPALLERSREYVLANRTTADNVWRWREAFNGSS